MACKTNVYIQPSVRLDMTDMSGCLSTRYSHYLLEKKGDRISFRNAYKQNPFWIKLTPYLILVTREEMSERYVFQDQGYR